MIYCVEDERNIRELIVYTLGSSGLPAKGVETGSQLFKELANHPASLILLDIMLPEEDGLSILKRLKSSEVTRDIPVIMVTAKGAEYDKVPGPGLRSRRLHYQAIRHDGIYRPGAGGAAEKAEEKKRTTRLCRSASCRYWCSSTRCFPPAGRLP